MDPLTTEETMEILEREPVAHLGTIVDGKPYVTPMSYVVDGEEILFRTMEGKKLDGIRANSSVCVEVSRFDHESGSWVSVIVRGTATFVEDPDTRQKTIARLFEKYEDVMGSPLSGGGLVPLGGQPSVVAVKIEEITGMSSGRGIHARTRPGRL